MLIKIGVFIIIVVILLFAFSFGKISKSSEERSKYALEELKKRNKKDKNKAC